MNDLWLDLRYALRSLRTNPGFTVVAVLTLALGLGATTAIYTVVDRVLLRSLPYPQADRLVRVWHWNERSVAPREGVAYETYQELDHAVPAIDATAGISPHWSFTISAPEPERAAGYWVSASFFELLGARPALGRVFGPAEDAPGGEAVVVLSHAYWQRRFGGDSTIVGRPLTIGGAPATVIGIMRPGFRYAEAVDVWAPLGQNPIVPRGRQVRWVDVLARLAPGATVVAARAEVATYADQLAAAYPAANGGLGGDVAGLYDATVGNVRPALWTLLGGVGFVLLIACANIGNLLLTRATARRSEVAVRSALGASSGRLIRQFLAESATLGVVGGALGLGLAVWLLDLFRAVGPADLPRLHEVGLDGRVLAVAGLLTLGASFLFGLAPALDAARGHLHLWLKEGGRALGGSGGRLRGALVVTEVALALVLLAGAGLLFRSFGRLMQVDTGFRADHVLTLQIAPPATYDGPGRAVLYERLYAELRAIPGVEAVGSTTRLPLTTQLSTKLDVRDRPVAEGDQPEVEFRRAGGDYFAAMGIPVLRGRAFDARDTPDAVGAMIVSRSLADRIWPGEDPIGKQVRFWYSGITPDSPWLDVIGVVGDVKHFGLDADAPAIAYFAASQAAPGSPLLAIRTAGDPAALTATVRERIRTVDPQIVLFDVRTMRSRVAESVAGPRFNLLLLALFGAVALTLAAVGIYGVIGYTVRQRTRELGIRIALGATRRDVMRLIVGGGMRLAVAGLAIGMAGVLLLTRLLRSMLFEVSPTDPAALATVCVVLGAVSLLAAYLPARRAARIAPTDALRQE
jgi:putative ABC transport system permease protein